VEGAGLRVTRLDTRSRGAAEYWTLSREVREKGRVDLARRRSRGEKLGGLLFETAEAVLIAVRPRAGDEIRLLARAGSDRA
jgi:hypothetical protein